MLWGLGYGQHGGALFCLPHPWYPCPNPGHHYSYPDYSKRMDFSSQNPEAEPVLGTGLSVPLLSASALGVAMGSDDPFSGGTDASSDCSCHRLPQLSPGPPHPLLSAPTPYIGLISNLVYGDRTAFDSLHFLLQRHPAISPRILTESTKF